MKKFITLMIFSLVAMLGYSQERTVSYLSLGEGTYFNYVDDNALDVLTETTHDTLDIIFEWKGNLAVEKIVAFAQLDTVAGADSIYMSLSGFNEKTSPSETAIIASTGKEVSGLNTPVEIVAFSVSAQQSFRYYRLRFIQASNNDYDGGATLDAVKFKIYQR